MEINDYKNYNFRPNLLFMKMEEFHLWVCGFQSLEYEVDLIFVHAINRFNIEIYNFNIFIYSDYIIIFKI